MIFHQGLGLRVVEKTGAARGNRDRGERSEIVSVRRVRQQDEGGSRCQTLHGMWHDASRAAGLVHRFCPSDKKKLKSKASRTG